ncbi:MAG: hypothetical protein K2N55_02540, partial [Lachnospiraceae bacterium]|nr:hypothetical protein [Lachnospiraceae bacterium]
IKIPFHYRIITGMSQYKISLPKQCLLMPHTFLRGLLCYNEGVVEGKYSLKNSFFETLPKAKNVLKEEMKWDRKW